MFSAQVIKSES